MHQLMLHSILDVIPPYKSGVSDMLPFSQIQPIKGFNVALEAILNKLKPNHAF